MLNRFFLLTSSTDEIKYDRIKTLAEDIFYFPDSLGDFVSNNVASHDTFTSSQDGNPVVLTYNNFTIKSGHTVTVSQRCKGLYLYIKGDLTVNGTLSMTGKGAKAEGKYVLTNYNVNKKYVAFFPSSFDVNNILELHQNYQIVNPTGHTGKGGNGGTYYGLTAHTAGGTGAAGTSFSGGAGGGGGPDSSKKCGGSANGGSGGNGATAGKTGGGAGNPGGSLGGKDGTGGLIILIVDGNINISGSVICSGCNGGNATGSDSACGGGGSGGGCIKIYHRGYITGKDKITCPGGTGGKKVGSAGGNGSAGDAGTVVTTRLLPKSEETLVGKWIDGKSIYRTRVIFNNTTLQGNKVSNTIDISSLDYDTIIRLEGTMQCKSETYSAFTEQFKFWCQAALRNMIIQVAPTSFNAQDKTIIDLYYTKSGKKYNGDNIFSLEETVIGTTVDSQPLYRKVVELTNPEAINTTYTTDISDIDMDKIVNFYGFYGYGNYGCQNINYHSLSRMWPNTELKIITTWINSSSWVNPIRRYAVLEYTKK